jgi:hypothetical protein
MPEALMTIGDCDRRVQEAEAAIDRLHQKRRRDPDTGWCYQISPKVRAQTAGHLLARLRALRRREQIERGYSCR